MRGIEFQQIVKATQMTIKEGTEVPEPSLDCFRLGKTLSIGAKISLSQNELPSIECNLGTLLSIDDLLLSSCCHSSFFTIPTGTGELRSDLSVYKTQKDFDKRYIDYSNIKLQSDRDKQSILTYQMPLSNSRLTQASLLSNIAAHWVLLHETSHWLMGHNHIAVNQSIDESLLHLINIDTENTDIHLSEEEKQCMELQADGAAFELLFHAFLCKECPNGIWEDYFNGQKESSSTLDLNTPENRIRALLVSSGCMVLLFERMRSTLILSESGNYPPPLTRLHNLFATAIRLIGTYSHVLTSKHDGSLVLSSEKFKQNITQFTQLSEGITMAMHDLAILTEYLQIEESLEKENKTNFNQTCNLISRGEMFLPDIASLMSGPSVSPHMKGENKWAVEEYIRLLPFQELLNQKLEDFALIEI